MAETLRELVVALSLDSSNFSRDMRTINQQIKESESTFRLAGGSVENLRVIFLRHPHFFHEDIVPRGT